MLVCDECGGLYYILYPTKIKSPRLGTTRTEWLCPTCSYLAELCEMLKL